MTQPSPSSQAEPANSSGQTVNGPQTNIAGDVSGPVLPGEFHAPVHVGDVVNIYNAPTTPGASDSESPAPGDPPYKGLPAFEEADAARFFGREALIAQLTDYLTRHNFLAILGASGSGKSSLMRAGLIPHLRALGRVHLLIPTTKPLEALAASLTRDSESVTATATLIDDLRRDPRSLHLYAKRLMAEGGRLFLLIDQFEETFTACKDEAERKAFIANLLTAVHPDTAGPTTVALTLRADFYDKCAPYADLREALKQQEYIGPMMPDELRRAIAQPAERGGWELQPGLLDILLRDVGDEPGALPLLSHALRETWERRSGKRLTLAGYTAVGGVRGALAKTAQETFEKLSAAEQAIARRIFLSLTELGEGTPDTRRREQLSNFKSFGFAQDGLQDSNAAQAVLQTLVNARLVITDEQTVEVAHEALIREWPTLRGWVDEDREGLRLHRQLGRDASEWQRLNRDEGALYRGARLAQAREWAHGHGDQLSALESGFITASQALAQREVETEKQAIANLRMRNRIITAVGAVALLAALIALWFGVQANQNLNTANQNAATAVAAQAISEAQAQTSFALALAAQAGQVLERLSDLNRAALLAIESLQRSPSSATNQTLAQVLYLLPQERARMTHDSGVNAVAFSPDGRWVVSGSSDATARVWDASTGQERARMTHDDGVYAVAFSPDGQWVVSGSWDGTARVWGAATGQERARMTHDDGVYAVAFSPDGQWVVSGSDDNTARVWNAATGQERARMTHDGKGNVTAVAFSPDGQWVVSGSDDNTARVWNAATGQERSRMTHGISVIDVAFSPDGQWVASAGCDKENGMCQEATARVWSAVTGQERVRVTAHFGGVRELAFSPDGQWVVSGNWDGTAWVWSAATGQERAWTTHYSNVTAVAFSPDGRRVVSGSNDGVVRVWEISVGQERARMTYDMGVLSVKFSPDGQWVASGSYDGTTRVWNAITGEERTRILLDNWAYAVTFSPDGQWVVSNGDNTARVWDATTGEERTRMTHDGFVIASAFSPDGQWVVSASADGTARVWGATTGQERTRIVSDNAVTSVAFSPDGQWLVSGGCGRYDGIECAEGTARVWNAATGQERARMTHDGNVTSVAFSSDGQWVVSSSQDYTVRVWDAATGQERARMTYDDGVTAVAFSPDGRWVVSGSYDNTARVWDAATGQERARMTHDSVVRVVAFSPDGQWVVSGSWDDTARVWDAVTGQERARMTHDDAVTAVAFSPDGQWVVSGSDDGTARVWLWRDEDLIALACERVGRNLTQAEWAQYLPGQPYRKTCAQWPEGE